MCCAARDDERVAPDCQPLDDAALMGSRRLGNRVQDGHHGHGDLVEHLEQGDTVVVAVDPELVLDDECVVAVREVSRILPRGRDPIHQSSGDPGIDWTGPVGAVDDLDDANPRRRRVAVARGAAVDTDPLGVGDEGMRNAARHHGRRAPACDRQHDGQHPFTDLA